MIPLNQETFAAMHGDVGARNIFGELLSVEGSLNERETARRREEEAAWANARDALADAVSQGKFTSAACDLEYAIDGDGRAHILACTAHVSALCIPAELAGHPVAVVGVHAFSRCYQLERIDLPETVEEIRAYAFMNTALSSFRAPRSLKIIGQRAFYRCAHLLDVALNDGVEALGDGAFRESGLLRLGIPASVLHIGRDAFRETPLSRGVEDAGQGSATVQSGAAASSEAKPEDDSAGLTIAPGGRLRAEGGALYRCDDEGLTLLQVLDEGMEAYRGPAGLAYVDDRAFSGLTSLRQAHIPAGVLSIGDDAFRGCVSLVEVELPDSLVIVGKRAFWGTALQSLRIPRALEAVGGAAFYTGDPVKRDYAPTIRSVEIALGNERFFVSEGTLCQHMPAGGVAALLHFAEEAYVRVPPTATCIGPYAFTGMTCLRAFELHGGIEAIGAGGVDFGQVVPLIVFDGHQAALGLAGEEQLRITLEYPPGSAGRQALRRVFDRGRFDVAYAFEECDSAILSADDRYAQARLMLARLQNPLRLSSRTAQLFRSRLKATAPEAVVAFGQNGYLEGIDALQEESIFDAENIDACIDAAVASDEIAVASKLMELKRLHFASQLFDFAL